MRALFALAIVMLLGTTAAAQPSALDARVIVAGSLAPAPLGVVELGLLANDWFYVHVDGALAYDYTATNDEYAYAPGIGGGLDLVWGAKTRGFAGPSFAYLHNLDRDDFHLDASLRFVVGRVGVESPVRRTFAIRGWLTLGAAELNDDTSGGRHYDAMPYGSLNLGVTWRPDRTTSASAEARRRFLVAAGIGGGGDGYAMGELELGALADGGYVHVDLRRDMDPGVTGLPALLGFGFDALFGRGGRGFAGVNVVVPPRAADDGLFAFFGRAGITAPMTRDIALRLWCSVGLELDEGYDPPWVPFGETHAAIAYTFGRAD